MSEHSQCVFNRNTISFVFIDLAFMKYKINVDLNKNGTQRKIWESDKCFYVDNCLPFEHIDLAFLYFWNKATIILCDITWISFKCSSDVVNA